MDTEVSSEHVQAIICVRRSENAKKSKWIPPRTAFQTPSCLLESVESTFRL